MSTLRSIQEAMTIAADPAQRILDREKAIHDLKSASSPEVHTLLVTLLMDDESGVRWTAADVLAKIGEPALPALLRTLVHNAGNGHLRTAAHHVLSANRSYPVHRDCRALLEALEGPASDIAVMHAAYALLRAKGLTALSDVPT